MNIIQNFNFLFFLLIVQFNSFTQTTNYIKYYNNVEIAVSNGIFELNNDTTIFYLKKAFTNAPAFPEDLLIMSAAFYNKGNKEKGFKYLVKSVKNGIDTISLNKEMFLTVKYHRQLNQLIK
jgi:hypothetical protein